MNIKDKIKEAAISHIVEKLLVLLALLLASLWLALKPKISQHILPALSKELLAGLLAGATILFLLATAYIVLLRKKLKPKLKFKFGVLWDAEQNLYCPKDQNSLHQNGYMPAGGLGQGVEVFECIKCDRQYVLKTQEGFLIDFKYAKKLLSSKSNAI